MFSVSIPTSAEEKEAYYQFRWQHLKEPWAFPQGSEKDEYESVSEHRVVVNENHEIVACGRVHLNDATEAQIRHIAVSKAYRRKGLGKFIVNALEQVSAELGAERAVTNSLDTSIDFFKANGFVIDKDIPIELGQLNRTQMHKSLVNTDAVLLHKNWCDELQHTWQEQIPITEHMGIKLVKYTGQTIETHASLNKNINLHGSMFAGSVYSLATLTGWGLLFLQLKREALNADIVLGDANIQYHKPLRNKPRAICRLMWVDTKLERLKKGNKCPAKLEVQVYDNKDLVATFIGSYCLIPC